MPNWEPESDDTCSCTYATRCPSHTTQSDPLTEARDYRWRNRFELGLRGGGDYDRDGQYIRNGFAYWDGRDPDESESVMMGIPGRDIRCRYCKAGPMTWRETQQGWRLFESNADSPHTCDNYSKN